jgi:hypothetical protein
MTELERLGRLGRVDPPAPGILDAAREVLWSAVAAEMLATAPDAVRPGAARMDAVRRDAVRRDAVRPDAVRPDAARAGGEPAAGRDSAAGRAADDIASQLRPDDPGAP